MAKRRMGLEDASAASLLPGLAPTEASAPDSAPDTPPDFHGHRDRLRQRFLNGGGDALPDYELLELLLFSALPRRDTKPLAKQLIKEFGSFAEVIAAPPDRLREFTGIKDVALVTLKAVQAAAQRLVRAGIAKAPTLNNVAALVDYCKATIGLEPVEQFRVLFLDTKIKLIKDETLGRGTVDAAPAYPREIVKRALDLGAKSIIMVHNHPSGDPKPSQQDIDMTRRVKDACATMGITLHDHIVIARGGYVSLKSQGLM